MKGKLTKVWMAYVLCIALLTGCLALADETVPTDCPHPSGTWVDESFEELGCTPFDSAQHTFHWKQTTQYRCDTCGKLYEVTVSDSALEAHVWNVTDGLTCAYCGDPNPCDHPNARDAEAVFYLGDYKNLGDGTHSVTVSVLVFQTCDDCFATWGGETSEHTEILPHAYTNGYCVDCYAINTCKHPDYERIGEITENHTYTPYDDAYHTHALEQTADLQCNVCGEVFTGVIRSSELEEHIWNDEIPSVCALCGETAPATATPTEEPSATPTDEPTATPTEEPTATPTEEPTATPTDEPTATPTEEPSATPAAVSISPATLTGDLVAGSPVTAEMNAQNAFAYNYWLFNDQGVIVQEHTNTTDTSWTFTITEPGIYLLRTYATNFESEDWTDTEWFAIEGTGTPVPAVTVSSVTVSGDYEAGAALTGTATVTSGFAFNYWLFNDQGVIVAEHTNTTDTAWNFSIATPGLYLLRVYATDFLTEDWNDSEWFYITPAAPTTPVVVSSASLSEANIHVGDTMTVVPSVSGGSGLYAYNYWVFNANGVIVKEKTNTLDSSTSFTFTEPGVYLIRVYATDFESEDYTDSLWFSVI